MKSRSRSALNIFSLLALLTSLMIVTPVHAQDAESDPVVNSIVRANSNPTLAASVDFTITFNQSVTGVDSADFVLTISGVTGASITGISGSNATYTVSVNTGSGSGTIRLDVTDNDSILSSASTPLGGTGSGNGNFTSGETYTISSLIVTTAADNTNDDTFCSLREAITNANNDAQTYADCVAGSGTDTITFAANYTITLGSQLPSVTSTIIINGTGMANTIIQADANPDTATYRVFQVSSVGNLSLNNLTLRNGRCNGSCITYNTAGGGILNAGALTVTNTTISGNSVSTIGGGIYNAGILTLTNSTISGNTAIEAGGVYNNIGPLTITNSTFSGNSSTGGGSSGGGAVENNGTSSVTNSTFSGNSAVGWGGGIYNNGTLTVSNNTFSGNSAMNGGGIAHLFGTLTVTNSTFSGNSASTNGGGIAHQSSGALTLNNSILANSISGGDCYKSMGATVSGSHNLIESDGSGGNACGTTAPINSDPGLAALAGNGGPTQTFALTGSSPAVGAGDNSICDDNPGPNNLDQRGVTRPQNGACDIGAFESNAQPGPVFVVNSNEDNTDGFCDAYVAGLTDCTLREAITYADSIGGSDTITFANALGTAIVLLQADLPTITDGSGLTVNGGDDITVDGNLSTHRPFLVSSGAVLTLLNLTVANGYSSGVGGGLRNDGGQVTITHSTFKGNIADQGGGIYNNSSSILTVTGSSFVDNYVGAGYGGGILTNSATATITNSTFSNNFASLEGGGIDNIGTGTLTLTNSTFSGNQSPTSGNGGGIYNHGTLHFKNTILANSVSSSDCYNAGAIGANLNNLVEDGSCSASLSGDPNLGSLTGSPAYFPLNAGSTAIGTGDNTTCAAAPVNGVDQRGIPRPQGTHCDIGAYEYLQTFADVAPSHQYWLDIEILYANGLTAGCSVTPLNFCPDQIMDRAQSAVFNLRGNFGVSYTPPAAPWDRFADDWSAGAWAERWAEGMYNAGLTAGCATSPLRYCPWDQTPKVQAAVFGLRLKYGNSYVPPAASGTVFADMTNTAYFGTKWSEQAYADGLLPNCGIDIGSGKPNFCPNDLVSRGLGADMIVKAKNLSMP
jgi:CSLREA domain-containing protein